MGTSAKVLIAEQDQSVIRLLKTVLTNAGHRVVLAKTSGKAAEAIEEYEIDIALVDSNLEGMGGMELARKLKKERPDVSVAFLSYFGSKRSALAANDAGVDRFILKPFDDLAAVNRTIREIIHERFERKVPEEEEESESDDAATTTEEEHVAVRVIVADTSKEELDEMSEALKGLHCKVTTATCAQEALLQLSKDEQDVLIVAYDMGDMTADDVLLRAKRLDEYVSVVVTSPEPNLTMTTNLIKKGASGFIEKPLKNAKRTAESIVRRGLAVIELREEIAQEEEEEEVDEAEELEDAREPDENDAENEEGDDSDGVGDGEEEDEEDEEEDIPLKPDTDYTLPENAEDDGEPSDHEEVDEDDDSDDEQSRSEDDAVDESQEDLSNTDDEEAADERVEDGEEGEDDQTGDEGEDGEDSEDSEDSEESEERRDDEQSDEQGGEGENAEDGAEAEENPDDVEADESEGDDDASDKRKD